jgi:hypothetical protein
MVTTPRLRRVLRRTLGGIVAAALGFYAAELVFRTMVLVPLVPETERQFDRVIAATWPRPVAPRKDEGTLRILGLADSFGLAGGAHNYHFLLEEKLKERGLPVDVVNFSVAAYSPGEELLLLRRFGPDFRPDLVLHGFFVGNDFGLPRVETGRFRGIDVTRVPGAAGWLPRNLMLTRWLGRCWEGLEDRRARRRERDRGLEAGSFSRERFLRIERVRLGACRRPTGSGPAWPVTTELLDAIGAEARDQGAAHVMVVHPDQFQVEPELAREIMETYGLDAEEYEIDLPQQYLRAYAASRRLPVVDLTPAFREEGGRGGLYLPQDTHYNDRGNELAAEVLAETLEPLLAAMIAPVDVAAVN